MNDTPDRREASTPQSDDPVEARVIAPLRRAQLGPDDLQVARLSSALDAALAQERSASLVVAAHAHAPHAPAPHDRAPWGRRRRVGWPALGLALGTAAAAALVLAVFWRRPPPPRETAAVVPPVAPIATGDDVVRASHKTLVLPAGAREEGRLGERVRFVLVGPAELSAFAVEGGTELSLKEGRLFVDYEGDGRELLRVRSPGAVTTVIGTVFAVEAYARTSRISVARGVVSVTLTEDVSASANATPKPGREPGTRRVSAGHTWRTDAPTWEPLPSDLAAELAAVPRPAPREAPLRATQATLENGKSVAGTRRIVTTPVAHDELLEHRGAAGAAEPRHAASVEGATSGAPESAYAAAEELMREGATQAARKALLELVAAHPRAPQAELALLDLARLALAAGHPREASGHLDRLRALTSDPALLSLARQIEERIDETLK